MILRSLTLENFGLYGGRTRLDLTPSVGSEGARPVVLIGGRNGAGKTTFLEAVRLALYGQRALGSRVGRAEYEAYLAERVHRAFGSGPNLAAAHSPTAVELEFDYAEAGVVHRYVVRREWGLAGGPRGRESLRLEKDGRIVDSVPRDEWHGFLQELVPPGVSQLFFFDGEKVQEMADSDDDSSLVDAVRGLLGIETVARLRTDIGFFLARHRRGQGGDAAGADLESTERELTAVDAATEAAVGEVAELDTVREARARVLEQARRRFVQEGGELATRRGELEDERDRIKDRIAQCQAELRELANGLLPFAVAPKLMARFGAAVDRSLALSAARDIAGSEPEAARLTSVLMAWRASGEPARAARWTEGHWRDLERWLTSIQGSEPGLGQPSDRRVKALSEIGDLPALRERLLHVRIVSAPRAAALAAELDGLEGSLRDIEGLLERADGFATSSALLLEEVSTAELRLNETATAVAAAAERLKGLRHQRLLLERQRVRLIEQGEAAASRYRQTALAGRVGEALAVYEGRLMARKVARLEEEFARAFGELARKDDLLEGVSVDPQTFRVQLLGRNGHEISKASLSAGERQIYAVALLWALARISGRPLPMIVDTPLARLDSEHRQRLVKRYFPAASHQVILLSTDEEIRGGLLKSLDPSISHAYHLEYDPAQGRTVVRPGYFGEDHDALPEAVGNAGTRGAARAIR